MTDEGAKLIAEAIHNLASKVERVACMIAEDQCLGEWISRGLVGAVEDIIKKGLSVTIYGPADGESIPLCITLSGDDWRDKLKPL
jgi:hypothetical protein